MTLFEPACGRFATRQKRQWCALKEPPRFLLQLRRRRVFRPQKAPKQERPRGVRWNQAALATALILRAKTELVLSLALATTVTGHQ